MNELKKNFSRFVASPAMRATTARILNALINEALDPSSHEPAAAPDGPIHITGRLLGFTAAPGQGEGTGTITLRMPDGTTAQIEATAAAKTWAQFSNDCLKLAAASRTEAREETEGTAESKGRP